MGSQKSVLVTGASGGLGSATVRRLDELGWRVFAGVRSADAGARVTLGLRAATPLELDVCDQASVGGAAAAVADELGEHGLDGLVNNAGVLVQGPLELVPLPALRRQFEVNVIGQVAVTQAFLPMLRSAGGRVVNIGAASGRLTVPMLGPISASKTALESLTDALRVELHHQGVRVSIVEPGHLQTSIFEKAADTQRRDGLAGTDEAQEVYRGAGEAFARALAKSKPSPVEAAVKAIVKALTASRPRARYLVGPDAWQAAVAGRMPEPIRDRLLLWNFGLKRELFEVGSGGT